MPKALGLVETKGLVAAIEAADAMVKAANVKFVGKDTTRPALITIKVTGDTAAVKAAVDAGAAAAQRVGQLVSTHVIPQPDEQLTTMLPEISEKPETRQKTETEVKTSPEKKIKQAESPGTSSAPKAKKKEKPPVEKKEEKKKEIIEIVEDEPSDEVAVEETPVDTIARLRQEALGEDTGAVEENEEKERGESEDTEQDIETMNVHQLRHLARSIPDFPIKGREISRANRDELLEHFKSLG